jgi:hypothetical protein
VSNFYQDAAHIAPYASNFISGSGAAHAAPYVSFFLSGSDAASIAPYVSIFHQGATRRICNPYVSIFIRERRGEYSSICVIFSSRRDAADM